MPGLTAYVQGIGLLGPGLDSWPTCASALSGAAGFSPRPTVVPAPSALPPAERRRTGTSVRLALAVGLEAATRAGLDPATLPSVFASSGGDGENCHEICKTLASSDRQLSPTRFHNSVHNAPAGYWGIATGATPPASVLCAYDASFAAGMLEALTQVLAASTPVLLIASDTAYQEPLRSKRPITDSFGVALVLTPSAGPASLARICAQLTDLPPQQMSDAPLEALRSSIPAARSLPLLSLIARHGSGTREEPGAPRPVAVLEYLHPLSLAVEVS